MTLIYHYTEQQEIAAKLFLTLFQDELDLPEAPQWSYSPEGFLVVEGSHEELDYLMNQMQVPDDPMECSTTYTIEPDLTFTKRYFDEVGEEVNMLVNNLVDWPSNEDAALEALGLILTQAKKEII